MANPRPHLFLVRLSGDVSIKARATRARFVRRLADNLRDALRSSAVEAEVQVTRSRLLVRADTASAGEAIARVFGVQSVSPAEVRGAPDLESVVRTGGERFGEAVAGRRFAVRARRVGDRAPIRVEPHALEVALGARLLPGAAGVDLSHPEVTAHVELCGEEAFLFTEVAPGPAGLPLGVEGRAISLLSGGFDSAVAAWLIQRRGVGLHHVFCNLGGAAHRLGVLRVAKVLADRWSYGTRPRLHAVDFEAVSADLRAHAEPRYWQVILKRLMLRAAERVARETDAAAVVTGEALGQVSSQTLPNLAVISRVTELPILRPLVGSNKSEIIERANAIGTGPLSAIVDEYCALVPRKPATSATLAAVEAEEARLDPAVLEQAVEERAILDLRTLDLDAIALPELETETVPEGATVIDLRSSAAFKAWHWPEALYLDFGRALAAYEKFDRGPRYVLYCEFGLKSAHLAELMQRAGFEVHHFRGGLRALVRHARERGIPGPETPVALA